VAGVQHGSFCLPCCVHGQRGRARRSISHGGMQATTRQTMRPMQSTLVALTVPELEAPVT